MHSSSSDRADAIDLVASNLLGRAARLTRLLMRSGAHEISRTEVGVLATLSDGPRRITQLAMTEALAQPTVTQLIDKLEARGLVSLKSQLEDETSVAHANHSQYDAGGALRNQSTW